jgi:spore coat polysaccharide biosynthesis protein SpsF
MARHIGVIQARMGSTRLPGKLLAPIAGRPLLRVLADRVRGARVDEWWLATTTEPLDTVAAAWGEALGMRVLRGDPEDVLSRFAEVAEQARPEWIVRLTADNPFVDAAIVDRVLEFAAASSSDHVTAPDPRELPLGYLPEAVRADALRELASADLPAHHRVHVTSALAERGRSSVFRAPEGWARRPGWRWTVDTEADLAMADAAFRAFGERWPTIGYAAMTEILDAHPEIAARNATVRQKGVTEG